MIAVLAREAGVRWLVAWCLVLGLASLGVAGTVLRLPLLDRGLPGSWVIASTLAVIAWYGLRPRWQRNLTPLARGRLHRALLVALVGAIVCAAIAPMAVAGLPAYEVTLYPALFAMAVGASLGAGNLGWAPVLVVAILAEMLNNLSLNAVSHWVHLHAEAVAVGGGCALALAVVVYVWHGPYTGFPTDDE